jgi:acyl-CoA synthetase (AMP-forming)/AMP-acid ligase II
MLGINFNSNKIAIIENDVQINYKDFKINILQISKFLKKKKIKKKDIIFVNLENSYFYILLYFACFINNHIIIPINKNLRREELIKLKRKLKPKIFISEIFDYHSIKIKKNTNIKFDINAINSIFFTSGTTGDYKGIMHNYKSLYNSSKNFSTRYSSTNDIRFLSFLPMSYMAGFLNSVLNILILNGTIILKKRFDFELLRNFFNFSKKFNINSLWATPTNIQLLNKFHKTNKNHSLKNVFVGMDKLRSKDKLIFKRKFNINCLESYGTSEALFVSAKKNFSKNESSGNLFKNVKVLFNHDEIIIKSNSIMLGYFKNKKDLNIKKNQESFYTGDIGYLKNKEIYITGRKKDLIIKGGENIYPLVLEKKLLKCKYIKDIKIVPIKDQIAGEEIGCAIVPKYKNRKNIIVKYISKNLPKIFFPKKILFFEKLPHNNNGKVDVKNLLNRFS